MIHSMPFDPSPGYEMIQRAIEIAGEEALPLEEAVPLPCDGGGRFLVPDDIDPKVIDRFRLGLEVAFSIKRLGAAKIQVQSAPRSTCEMTARLLGEASNRADVSTAGQLHTGLVNWLRSKSQTLPILQIIGSDVIDSRPQVTAVLRSHGLVYSDGSLIYLPAQQVAGLLEQPDCDEKRALKACECLVIQGLAESQGDWAVLIRYLALRAGLGKCTILVDRVPPDWPQHSFYGELLRPATEVLRMGDIVDTPNAEDRSNEEEERSHDSDRELILVAASVVARRFGLNGQALLNRRSNTDGLKARQAAIFVARKWKRFEFGLIGSVLGQRTAVSAAQAYKRIEDRYHAEPDFARLIDLALEELANWDQGLLSA